MATEPLQIEWLPQPSNFPEDKQSLVIKDPLPVIATLRNFTPPSEEDKAEWPGPKSLEEFWLMLQHFLKVEINEQLSHIHDIAIRYQEANAIQIGYLQQAVYNMTIHTFDLRVQLIAALTETPPTEKDGEDSMDWEWTPKPLSIPDLAINLKNKIKKGKSQYTPTEDPGDAADRAARSQRGGTVPPLTPKGSLGSSENTGRKWRTTLTSKKGSGAGASPKKPREPGTGGDPSDSSNDSDSDASNNPYELPKKKLTSEDLLHKYVKAIAQDYKRRNKVDAPKLQPYKVDT